MLCEVLILGRIDIDESTLSDGVTVRSFTELPAHDRESLRSAIGNSGLLHAPHYTSFSVMFAYEQTEIQGSVRVHPGWCHTLSGMG